MRGGRSAENGRSMAYQRKSYVEHVAVRVKDIGWHIRFFREALGMPIRDADMAATACAPWVIANRGASGIDGNIATAAGIAWAGNRPVTAIVGDLAALHDLNMAAEFWVEPAGELAASGVALYLTTDQVRFYRSDAAENRARSVGGGYYAGQRGDQRNAEPLPLDSIPPLVFSEIMRDVDLFVGVASIGNDPNWLDGGAGVRYRDYWQGYSFGDLSESAKTRKQVLEKLLPRLKIAGRCQVVDKFLVVSGDLRKYKIHLGSGNILMEPNDQYLCIVPSRGGMQLEKERLYLPFEGDQTLAVILSKAFLLAEDRKITDPTIVRQLKR